MDEERWQSAEYRPFAKPIASDGNVRKEGFCRKFA